MSENVKKTIDFKTAFNYIDDIWRFVISKKIFANESSAEVDSIEDILICEKIKLAKKSSIEDYFKNYKWQPLVYMHEEFIFF